MKKDSKVIGRRNISITNEEVVQAFEEVANVSKFIEECVLYYLKSKEEGFINKEKIRQIVFECLRELPAISGDISNPNYLDETNAIEESVKDILKL